MERKPSYQELESRIRELEQKSHAEKKIAKTLVDKALFLEAVKELEQTNLALEQSEENMRQMLNATKDPVLLLDINGNFIDLNDIIAKRFKKKKKALIGVNCCDILPIEIAQKRKTKLKEAVRTGKIVNYQDEQSGIFYDHNIYPLLNLKGDVVRLAVFSHDISNEKWIEKILLQNETRLKIILKNLPGAILITDLKGRIHLVNKEACRNTGYSESELLNLTVDDIDKESIKRSGSKVLWQFLDFGKPMTMESVFTRKGESRYPVELHLHAITLSEVPMILATAFDISIRKKAEKTIEDNRRQLESILNNINAFIYISDMKTHEILFVNKRLTKLIGEEPRGRCCWQFFHNDNTGPCETCTNSKLTDTDGNPTKGVVWEFFHPKFKRWFKSSNLALPWMDGSLVRLDMSIDITKKKEIEIKQKKIEIILKRKVEERTIEMQELNTALKVLLKQRENDGKKFLKNIVAKYETLIHPFVQRLKTSLSSNQQIRLMDILEINLREFILPLSRTGTDPLSLLTPAETQIAIMVKQGLSNKEIAQIQYKSVRTITNHRDAIRKKLGLTNKKVNLCSFLRALT